jgi:hypothetical protein|tara:strand:- start:313 stop:567 length:255 start_codon:yes stop_codon:yes gene_type:complete
MKPAKAKSRPMIFKHIEGWGVLLDYVGLIEAVFPPPHMNENLRPVELSELPTDDLWDIFQFRDGEWEPVGRGPLPWMEEITLKD